jgi:hypothetical protein
MKAFFKKSWWVFASVFALWIAVSYFVNQSNKTHFQEFYVSTVAGKIIHLERQNHGLSIAFILDNNKRYTFYPTRKDGDETSGASGFIAAAALGDSIQKKSMSDTLLLIKKGNVLQFPFDKIY